MSGETAVNVAAVIVAALIGVFGSWWGAKQGADATRQATERALVVVQAMDQQSQQRALFNTLRVLAVEIQGNIYILDRFDEFLSVRGPSAFTLSLERTAMDAALADLYILPRNLGMRVLQMRFYALRLNTLMAFRAELRRESIPHPSVDQEIDRIRKTVVEAELLDLATAIESWCDEQERAAK